MSSKATKGLGRGFDVLLPTNFDSSILVDEQDRIKKVRTADIKPHVDQPRKHFDEEALGQLAESIEQYGILQPLVVTPAADGSYTIIAGERRWRAAQKAGLEQVPVIVRTAKELEQLEIALVENVQRVDLSPLEQAASIERLHQQFSLGYGVIAKRLGKAEPTVKNIVRLLQLPEDAQKALREERITEGHARSILALKDQPTLQTQLLQLIQKNNWSVRQAEQFVVAHKEKKLTNSKEAVKRTQAETPITKQLTKRLGVPVSVHRMAKGGRLIIRFKTDEELERITHLFK